MATLLPDIAAEVTLRLGFRREVDVLQLLQRTLPDGYEIFHGVDWHSLHESKDCHGEIDFVVMNRSGSLLLIEVKAGELVMRDGKLFKAYGQRERDVAIQVRVQYSAMRSLLDKAGIKVQINNCLVLPDYRVDKAAIVAIPRERIVDAADFSRLSDCVQTLLPLGECQVQADRVRAFLSNHLAVAPDVSVLRGQLQQATRSLADGLATWVPRVKAPTRAYRIQATAGSGKTQLALKLLQNAFLGGQRAMYVCFNRPLADQMAALAPNTASIKTFHSMCVDHYRARGGQLDFHDPSSFEKAASAYLAQQKGQQQELDLLIIDEAQDFKPEWITAISEKLSRDGRLYVMEDPDQSLYGRSTFTLPESVLIQCHDNFRSPQQVCAAINAFGLASQPIQSKSPWRGEVPAFFVYDGSDEDLQRQTELAVSAELASGVDVSQIAVLSTRGLAHSALRSHTALAGYSVRRFTGEFDVSGKPCWTDGQLLVDSVYRFKGQSVTAVILTEVDFSTLGAHERALLFVGMTRGLMSVSLVLSKSTAALLVAAMQV
ncbi:NERD domain-containing protein [Vogesella indigofera]|uniref:AAA family ATPase n=1 Tax=Vogesella indigofera TaxID=45465 RepID=A0ABT5I2H9_VOGIN|nr:NERD domain-containing protein [Vogesella indigofera]MDC7690380.1 AAA family ATPase [Vogesella indigofera]